MKPSKDLTPYVLLGMFIGAVIAFFIAEYFNLL
jgi:hypothetical protein